ncbi:MAG: VWA domain-containing protein [Planctomycetes bacterium]|nr:VWA domain-containing protein [Planctomycetota bacterium]
MQTTNRAFLVHVFSAAIAFAVAPAPAGAEQVKLQAALGHPVLKAGEKRTTHLKVGITGFRFLREADRAPVNVVLVIDTSGSMQGDKIAKAREAAILAIRSLGPRDIVAVVEYDDRVRVMVPATKVTDPEPICAAIRRLEPGSGTALFAGVSKGAEEVRKFLDRSRVNRIILLSDGLANVGPSSPAELGDLGASLVKEGISVTTIGLGLGFNEDLMSQLARRSDGNHYFAENSTDLARIFRGELGDVLTVAAQEVVVKIHCAGGVRPVRVLGREADITGPTVVTYLNQVYSEQEKYVLLEVEVSATPAGETRPIASVEVSYSNMQTRTRDVLTSSVAARFSDSDAEVEREMNKDVVASAVEQLATITNKMAMKLRDEGKIEEARSLLMSNYSFLEKNAVQLKSELLRRYAEIQKDDERSLEGLRYHHHRKIMVEEQSARESQQKSK